MRQCDVLVLTRFFYPPLVPKCVGRHGSLGLNCCGVSGECIYVEVADAMNPPYTVKEVHSKSTCGYRVRSSRHQRPPCRRLVSSSGYPGDRKDRGGVVVEEKFIKEGWTPSEFFLTGGKVEQRRRKAKANGRTRRGPAGITCEVFLSGSVDIVSVSIKKHNGCVRATGNARSGRFVLSFFLLLLFYWTSAVFKWRKC